MYANAKQFVLKGNWKGKIPWENHRTGENIVCMGCVCSWFIGFSLFKTLFPEFHSFHSFVLILSHPQSFVVGTDCTVIIQSVCSFIFKHSVSVIEQQQQQQQIFTTADNNQRAKENNRKTLRQVQV